MIKSIAVTLAAVATVANGDTNLRSNAQVQSRATAPQGTKFYAIMGKISGRKNKLAPGIGVHCLDRGTTKATEAPYDGKVWGEKHGALSVQCCGADNYRDNSDPLKKWVVKEQGNVFATRFTRNVVPGGKWNLDACESGKTLDEAFAICANKGLRMCTKDEVMANEQNIGCNTGGNLQWTSTPCDGAVGGTPNKDVSTELGEIRNEFKDLIAASEPPTEEEEKADDKFACTTDKNFIEGSSYSQIEVNINGQPSRKIFDEYEAVAFCRNECDKREASGAGCKAFWYQRHGPNPNESRGTHGYKLCAFYKKNGGNAVRHGHGGKSQVCVRKAESASAVASSAPAAADANKFKPGCYDIVTSAVHSGPQSKQPAGWGLSAWMLHGAKRNGGSSWAAVHEGKHWPMPWSIQPSKRTPGTFTIKTTGKHAGSSGKQPAGWGLSSWMEHGAKRNNWSARVAVHGGDHWLMDWKIEKSTRTPGTWVIKTSGVHSGAQSKQPADWGLSTWQEHQGKRNHASSWVYTHEGKHWLMDWKLEETKGC